MEYYINIYIYLYFIDTSESNLNKFEKLYQDAQERDSKLSLNTLRSSMEHSFKPKVSKKAMTVNGKFEDRLKRAEDRVQRHIQILKETMQRIQKHTTNY